MLTDRQKYTATLALTIERVRDSSTGSEPQVAALRVLVDQAEARSVAFRMYDGILTVDGEQIEETPYASLLAECLAAHGLLELIIARYAEPTELLALARALGAKPGQGRIKERLRDVASNKVMVIIERPEEVAKRSERISIGEAFARIRQNETALAEWNQFLNSAAQHAEEHEVKLGLEGAAGAPAGAAAPVALPPGGVREALPPRAAPPEPPAPGLAQPATLQAATPLGIALARLLGDPYGADTLPKLTQLSRQLEDAFRQDRVAEAIDVLNTVIEVEAKAPTPQSGASYGVILRRLLSGSVLALVAPYLLEPRRAHRARAVMLRGGEAGLDLMVGLLAGAASIGERQVYLDVLRALPRGADRVVGLLQRPELHVVRSIAELAGVARLDEAVPYLARFMEHDDERLRRTAAVALARIGSVSTVEPVRRALREGTPELRSAVAGAIGGEHARALTSLLVSSVEGEGKPELVREYCRALGRIGTSEAIQMLSKMAEPGGKLIGRKPTSLRISAIEGLHEARAASALDTLLQDGDRAVREAAQRSAAALAVPAKPAP